MTEQRRSVGDEAEADVREAIEEAEPAAEDMERRSERLEERIERTGRDWEAKKHDPSVPGAQPPLEEVEEQRQDLGGTPGGEER